MPLYHLEGSLPELARSRRDRRLRRLGGRGRRGDDRPRDPRRGRARHRDRFDPDQLFDYRSRRPTLLIRDGRLASLDWPEITLKAAPVRRPRHPGPHGRRARRPLAPLRERRPWSCWASSGVGQWISLGAIPAAVAHTRHACRSSARRPAPGLLRGGVLPGPAGLLARPVGRAVDARDGGVRVGRARRGLLRPDPPLRLGRLRARRARAGEDPRAAPRRRPAPRRPRRGEPPAAGPPRRRDRGRRDDPRLRRAPRVDGRRVAPARRATTSSPTSSGSCATGAATEA